MVRSAAKGDSMADQNVSVEVTINKNDYEPQWSGWVRQMAAIALLIGGVFALTLLAPVIQILVGTFLLAFFMYVPSRFIARNTRLNFAGSVAVNYFLLIMFLLILLLTFLPPLIDGVRGLAQDI